LALPFFFVEWFSAGELFAGELLTIGIRERRQRAAVIIIIIIIKEEDERAITDCCKSFLTLELKDTAESLIFDRKRTLRGP
jgi:hypothetical protein